VLGMAQAKSTSKTKGKSAQKGAGFSAEEKAAMRERAREMKAAANKEQAEREVLAKIAAMQKQDRAMAERVHAIVKENAPELAPRTWYGMPAYAKDDKVLCFFRDAAKFKTRYATFGFSDKANLDEDGMWATDFAVKELTPKVEKQIAALVKKAVS
jgi:uncharacterized protein YdhG (YjbR/CyaY superfamily)